MADGRRKHEVPLEVANVMLTLRSGAGAHTIEGEVIKDMKSGDSLQYAFVEFDNQESAEEAYFKMDNALIDDRRIHVDFSQSVSKVSRLIFSFLCFP